MYELTVRTRFAAAHSLMNYDGPCARLHGHTWQVEVVFQGHQLDQRGMLVDFKELKSSVKDVIDELDHQNLNMLEPFKQNSENNPTAENLARYIFNSLKTKFTNSLMEAKIAVVRVGESPEASAAYREED
ncbi:6-carboxytetrahydropterin synthase QueD [Pelotomaculum terephthalicicum JT]|uniref:6-carboxytetrahydropterin synthase QueD n=1 Tax=Pelotomaculum TaxID=191373 RepID=UPI0009CF8A4B|nr:MULTISPECIES: 6-carboxytetrahydropterin synthase QueD [Pelotomaculum]MCG9967636.1 6-carboxytetrahydropterin synthase QueD [Pelotomaculum terephthalicicum JT]OPX84065.1 MAG: 6-carboxy-5,6,7,8-tetrahydropterin synthase [Pelotomaculum sp. PtaB.Bin117]OPY60853.1 MAG: 6-carboxy-5,6,7,8-tetrahydropterin synthase [Pelotomaculum sp. PtaU1.Bin065]